MNYIINTQKSWSATQRELRVEFERWGVTDWVTNYPRGAEWEGRAGQTEEQRTVRLTYTKNGKPVTLSMGKQSRAVDNLRVLYLAVESMRLNEKRGIGEVLESAYLQLAGPAQEKSPWEVLGIMPGSSVEVAEAVYRTMANKYHPDKGSDPAIMKQLNSAIDKIRKGEYKG